ncbi:TatD family hydrolase [Lentibacillus sp. JNUCC-1]|uniref:TatD family hydrolase n=1 Tax=Lentibacillus sp. JNUCC-1 TaxID=2654513 RepID=UPI0012E96382|nr:TatD family hydrolase [Lentibacillus sp. JNUCC-1]
MDKRLIDSHIHIDKYEKSQRDHILSDLQRVMVDALIAVSNDLESTRRVLRLAAADQRIKPAIGYHPEQAVPDEREQRALIALIEDRKNDIAAIGEIGLPYYLRQEQPDLDLQPYIDLLERFIQKAALHGKPVILHAIYEDAVIVCDLLEAYGIQKAHFHWFKGEDKVLKRIVGNGHVISVTPDVVYEPEIQHIVKQVPLEQLLVETDGPWPFEGPFEGEVTHPEMMHHSIEKIAAIKGLELTEVYRRIYKNTCEFYKLEDLL